jgi:predicted transcriptional regulator
MDNEMELSPKLVRDLMTVGVETCAPETPIVEIARAMLDRGFEEIVVLEEGNALGVVGQDDIVFAFTREDFRSLTAEEIMREGVPQIPPDIPISVAAQMMHDQGVRVFWLMHHAGGIEYPAASISYRHLLRYLAADSDEDLRDLGLAASRTAPLEAFIRRRDAALQSSRRKRG